MHDETLFYNSLASDQMFLSQALISKRVQNEFTKGSLIWIYHWFYLGGRCFTENDNCPNLCRVEKGTSGTCVNGICDQ